MVEEKTYSLKPGYAYRRVEGQIGWEVEIADEMALKTAEPSGMCYIDGVYCVDFVDARGRAWAQTMAMARDAVRRP